MAWRNHGSTFPVTRRGRGLSGMNMDAIKKPVHNVVPRQFGTELPSNIMDNQIRLRMAKKRTFKQVICHNLCFGFCTANHCQQQSLFGFHVTFLFVFTNSVGRKRGGKVQCTAHKEETIQFAVSSKSPKGNRERKHK